MKITWVKSLLPTKTKTRTLPKYSLGKIKNQWNTKWDEFVQTVTSDMPHRTCMYVGTKLCNGGKGLANL